MRRLLCWLGIHESFAHRRRSHLYPYYVICLHCGKEGEV